MKEFLEFIAKSLVNKPEAVKVEETKEEDGIKYKLYVDDNEIGKVIGKKGKIAKSIRTLLIAVAAKNGFRVTLDIPDKMIRVERKEKDFNVKES
jgi:predicted RNA-binding protein YlqC (UPF0109 family)